MPTKLLRDLALLWDFFQSFAITSLLFFESLFAIEAAEALTNWMIKDGGCRGSNARTEGLKAMAR